MEPFNYVDHAGDGLKIEAADGFPGLAAMSTFGNSYVQVGPEEFPAIIAALYEACGLPSPVVITAPDIPQTGLWEPWTDSPLSLYVENRKVRQLWRDGPSLTMDPVYARALGAALIVLAAMADTEPDPAEVEELAERISAEMARRAAAA